MNSIIKRNCLISKCKNYRWKLNIKLSYSFREIIFIGLNPSLSDNKYTDNTTRKIIKISENYKYGNIKIINLFAFISKSPRVLKKQHNPIGFLNDEIINKTLIYWSMNKNCDLWLGWGNNGNFLDRNLEVEKMVKKYLFIKRKEFSNTKAPLLIKETKLKNPIHPLYTSNQSSLKEYLIY